MRAASQKRKTLAYTMHLILKYEMMTADLRKYLQHEDVELMSLSALACVPCATTMTISPSSHMCVELVTFGVVLLQAC